MTHGTRRKILHVTGVSVGGSAEHVLLLAKSLDPERFDVHVALWSGGPLDHTLSTTGRALHFLDSASNTTPLTSAKAFSGGSLRFVTGFVRLVRLIRRERFDVVHTHTSVAGVLGRVAATIARVPVRLHMLHSIAGNEQSGGRWRRAAHLAERLMDRLTTHYVAGSDAIAATFVASGLASSSRVTRIHYSMDVERFEAGVGRCVDDTRAALGASSPDDVVVSLVGRLEAQKGVEHLIAVMPQVLAACPTACFAIVGDGSLRAALERQVCELGVGERVRFTGWHPEIGAVMHATDILAIPSRWEAFGIVNLEAMAASKPVVGFAVEGIPEVVVDGETGLLVERGDEAALAAALIRLVGDRALRFRFGHAGRARFEQNFLPQAMVAGHEALYAELLDREGAAR